LTRYKNLLFERKPETYPYHVQGVAGSAGGGRKQATQPGRVPQGPDQGKPSPDPPPHAQNIKTMENYPVFDKQESDSSFLLFLFLNKFRVIVIVRLGLVPKNYSFHEQFYFYIQSQI
jgi:hypothetical protein